MIGDWGMLIAHDVQKLARHTDMRTTMNCFGGVDARLKQAVNRSPLRLIGSDKAISI